MDTVEPMRLYQLLWLLIRQVLRGRGRCEVQACVSWSPGQDGHAHGGITAGPVTDFSWAGADGFVVIDAHCDARPDPELLHH